MSLSVFSNEIVIEINNNNKKTTKIIEKQTFYSRCCWPIDDGFLSFQLQFIGIAVKIVAAKL